MAKPKSVIFPRAVKQTETQETTVLQNDTVMEKLIKHIDNKDIHIDTHTRDSISYMRKDIDNHIYNDAHITDAERAAWNSKETVAGSQSKANKVMNSLEAHKNDLSVHITKQEKTLLKDKYTKAEVRNLLKHALTGLNFLPSVSVFGDLAIKYPNPKFNSCAKVRSNSKSYIYNGNEWIEFDIEKLLTPEATIELDGLMSKEDKIKLDTIEEYANNYIHPDDIDTRHVSDEQISRWDNKAEGKLVSILTDGLMSKEDKIKLDTIEDSANYYIHPETHSAVMIEEDETHRFITDEERVNWDNKPNKDYVDNEVAKTLLSAKSFTDSKVAAMFNT